MKEKLPYNVKFLPITELEKADLKNKIFNSIHKSDSRKRSVFYAMMGVAASLVILIGLGLYFKPKQNESITDFVKTLEPANNNSASEVTLVLGAGENLKIDDKVASISYSNSGEEVKIGSAQTVNQQSVKNNKLVYNTLLVPYGKRTKIQLSDGSTVWLNSGSRLVYPIVFKGKRREVYLEGEAIFDVAHNKKQPFIVMSQNQEVEVLGTVFGVTNYLDENSINTVLKSGSVQISYKNNSASHSDKMKITPGTIASYNKKTKGIISEKVNVDNYFSWREGVLIFKNNDLQFIMKRLSRYYNIDIEISNALKSTTEEVETFSGYLDLNEDVDKVIESIEMSTNLNYTFKNNKLTIN
ncbi:FecR family protein [Mariniflexile sp.]|uniref:FecR family protein n=1 Tax=Mariniflexile sp. TaxID=1979402 RepID=UPI003567ED67